MQTGVIICGRPRKKTSYNVHLEGVGKEDPVIVKGSGAAFVNSLPILASTVHLRDSSVKTAGIARNCISSGGKHNWQEDPPSLSERRL